MGGCATTAVDSYEYWSRSVLTSVDSLWQWQHYRSVYYFQMIISSDSHKPQTRWVFVTDIRRLYATGPPYRVSNNGRSDCSVMVDADTQKRLGLKLKKAFVAAASDAESYKINYLKENGNGLEEQKVANELCQTHLYTDTSGIRIRLSRPVSDHLPDQLSYNYTDLKTRVTYTIVYNEPMRQLNVWLLYWRQPHHLHQLKQVLTQYTRLVQPLADILCDYLLFVPEILPSNWPNF